MDKDYEKYDMLKKEVEEKQKELEEQGKRIYKITDNGKEFTADEWFKSPEYDKFLDNHIERDKLLKNNTYMIPASKALAQSMAGVAMKKRIYKWINEAALRGETRITFVGNYINETFKNELIHELTVLGYKTNCKQEDNNVCDIMISWDNEQQ